MRRPGSASGSRCLLSRLGGRSLTLGYAIMLADLVLAPFTPSNTARSGGTIFPVIKNIPEFYQSLPNDPSSRRIGSYLMWTAIASTCITSSMFLTGLAPNLLAVELVQKTAHIDLSWGRWFIAFLPVALVLLLTTPALAYVLYPPELKKCPEVPEWARNELGWLGPMSAKEMVLIGLVLLALGLWIFGGSFIDPTTAALLVVGLLVVTRTIGWSDVLEDKPAFNTLIWFGTLVALAGRANRADARDPAAATRAYRADRAVLHVALSVRQRDRACHGAVAADADGGGKNPRPADGQGGSRVVPDARHHGHHLALRHRPEPGLCRQRLSAGSGLLASGRDLRRLQSSGLPVGRRADPALRSLIGCPMDHFDADILILGAGGAGLRAAIAAAQSAPNLTIALVSKVYPMRSH